MILLLSALDPNIAFTALASVLVASITAGPLYFSARKFRETTNADHKDNSLALQEIKTDLAQYRLDTLLAIYTVNQKVDNHIDDSKVHV